MIRVVDQTSKKKEWKHFYLFPTVKIAYGSKNIGFIFCLFKWTLEFWCAYE